VPQNEGQFAKILIEATDHGLLVLGESARKSIYFHLEKDFSLTKEKIPENTEAFAKGLASIFGAGALVIEKAILESLHSKLGLRYEEKTNSRFTESLRKAKENWLKTRQGQA